MKLAFYAPMKSPDHPIPSGDRTIARNLMAALNFAGAEVTLSSTFNCREGKGEAAAQTAILQAAQGEAEHLIAAGKAAGWQAWISYHNYYKAPDLLGPTVTQALGIPYVQIESTRARKRLGGPWDLFARQAEAAAEQASLIFYFTERDAEALAAYAPPGQKLCHLKPFLRRTQATYRAQTGRGIISVGMMRARDKLPSYQLIAATLHHLSTVDWTLSIVGDGPERGAVETLMQPFGGKVRFLGTLDEADLCNAYRSAAIFLWPGVNEAIGMTYLEAQAESLAVVAQDRPGLRDVLPQGHHPTPEEGSAALARRLDDLLQDPQLLETEGRAAYDNLVQHHLLPQAADTLKSGLAELGVTA